MGRYLTMKRLDFMNSDQKAQTDESGSTAAINFNQENLNLNLQAAVENLEKTLIPNAFGRDELEQNQSSDAVGHPPKDAF